MKFYFYEILLFFILLIQQTKSFVRLSTIAYLNDTALSVYINYVKITNSGQIAYVSFLDTDGVVKIKSYNISTGSFFLLKSFIESPSRTITPNQIMLYSTYLIGVQSTAINFTVFNLNGTFVGRHSVNQTISEYIQSPSQGIIVQVSTAGKLYWVDATDFLNGNNKNPILQGILGSPKAIISPNTNYLAAGGSSNNKVYLVELVGRTLQHTWTLNGTDTRALTWSSDGTKIYAATSTQGLIYQLLISSPYTIRSFSYENANIVTAYHIEYYSTTNQLTVFTYKTSKSDIVIYSYYLSNSTIYHKQNITYTSTIYGNNWDRSNPTIFCDWSLKQIWVKQVIMTCLIGYYYDQCLGICNFCSPSCLNCTAEGCGTCPVIAPVNATNTVNTTNTTNMSNTTNNTNTTNINTNIPSNTTNNTINTNTNATINNSSTTSSKQMRSLYKNFEALLNNTIKSDGLSVLNKVPGGRRFLKPIFTFFGNLDDFWFYIYHQRNYQFVMASTFQSIQQLQNQKWELIPYQSLWGSIGLDTSKLKQFFSYKLAYSSNKFIKVEDNPNGFFVNTANFFLSNMLITIIMFLVCRFFFYLFFKYRISIFLRQFSFWPYLVIILMDGNLQFASFLVAFQLKWLFAGNILHKVLTAWVLVLFYSIFVFSIGAYFLFRYVYGELSKYFFDNSKNSNEGAVYMMINSGIRNILLGFAHLVNFQNYTTKISIIFMIQFTFFSIGIRTVSTKNFFEYKIKPWINLTASFMRLIVIGIFFFEQNTIDSDITYTSPVFVYLISTYILVAIISVLIDISKMMLQMLGFCRNQQLQKMIFEQQKFVHEIALKNNKKFKIMIIEPIKQKNIPTKAIQIQNMHAQTRLDETFSEFNYERINLDNQKKTVRYRGMNKSSKLPKRIQQKVLLQSEVQFNQIGLNVSVQGQSRIQKKPRARFLNMNNLLNNRKVLKRASISKQ